MGRAGTESGFGGVFFQACLGDPGGCGVNTVLYWFEESSAVQSRL